MSKFKVGDRLVVVRLPEHSTRNELIGFEFEVTDVINVYSEPRYHYFDEKAPMRASSWSEKYVELSAIAKSPLYKALQ